MDRYAIRATWLYYNDIYERWLPAITDGEMTCAKLFILPPGTDPEKGYETGWYKERVEYPEKPCCPQHKGRCLPSIDVSRHGLPPVWY
jgi:hypothetical protein